MVSELSIKVKVFLDVPGIIDVPLEFYASGANFAEVRAGTEEFVKDYIAFNSLENVQNIEYVYAEKHGVIRQKISELLEKFNPK